MFLGITSAPKMEQLHHRHLLKLNTAPTALTTSRHLPLFKLPTISHSTYSAKPFNAKDNKLILHSTCRFRHICKSNGSDTILQPELGRPEEKQKTEKLVNGIFWILLLNLGIYAADHWFHVREIKALYLYYYRPAWYQFVTATFCHANWDHISSNLFFLLIFGKLVEEEEGNLALWTTYILAGAGANLVSWLLLPVNAVSDRGSAVFWTYYVFTGGRENLVSWFVLRHAVSIGASGAVFGLFVISVFVKLSWDWRKILEVLFLGQFVIGKVMEAAEASAGLSARGYSFQGTHQFAHFFGAFIVAVLLWFISRVTSYFSTPEDNISSSIQEAKEIS